MLNKLKKTKSEGFTIIEVMIVLAIAGLIILVVLLAIPALQRNGRNATIKKDASALAGAVSRFKSNNYGSLPDAAQSSQSADGTVVVSRTSMSASRAKIQASTSYVDSNGAGAYNPPPSQLRVYYGGKCPATVPAAGNVTVTANSNSTAIVYATETRSGDQHRCLDA